LGIHPDQRAKISTPGQSAGFPADAVEDAVEGAYKELPYNAVAQSVFALLYRTENGDHSGKHPESWAGRMIRGVDEPCLFRMKGLCNLRRAQGISWQKITASL